MMRLPASVGGASVGEPASAAPADEPADEALRKCVAVTRDTYSGRRRVVPVPTGRGCCGSTSSDVGDGDEGKPERYSAELAAAALDSGAEPPAPGGAASVARLAAALGAAEGFASPPAALRAVTVLHVAMRPGSAAQLTLAMLQHHGFQPRFVTSVEAALAALRAPPGGLQLLVADATLPDFDAKALLRSMEDLPVPLAVLLPSSRRADAAELLRQGVAACLVRPLKASEVTALWQLPLRHMAYAHEDERRQQREAHAQQRDFRAALQNFPWNPRGQI